MTIPVNCECGAEYRLSDDKAGKSFNCRECQTRIRVPRPNALESSSIDDHDSEFSKLEEFESGRRTKSKSLAAKKRRPKASDSQINSRVRRTILGLSIGLGIGVVFLIGWAVSQGQLIPMLSGLTFLLTIVFPFAKDWYFRRRIREEIESYGGTVEYISWRPFQGAFFTRGWKRSRQSRFYEVIYTDKSGRSQSTLCSMSVWGGAEWGEDIDDGWGFYGGGMDVELIAYRVAPILLLIGAWAAGIESVYSLWGETAAGKVTQVTEVQTRNSRMNQHRSTRRYLNVQYEFQEADGTARKGSSRIKIGIATPDIQKGNPVTVEYIPGGWARLSTETYKTWLKVAAWIIAFVAVVLIALKCMDYFDVFQLHSRKS
jgi:hypothetical protein